MPVDSEHSALAQCLRAGSADEVARLILTASRRARSAAARATQLRDVTVADALAHPTWDMGAVITINSATLANKGLEVIEAHLLFEVPIDRIEVVVHPQSIVHSMVEFHDGAVVAKLSPPDMRLPIQLALGWPERLPHAPQRIDWAQPPTLTFEPLDEETFPMVALARHAGRTGGTAPGDLQRRQRAGGHGVPRTAPGIPRHPGRCRGNLGGSGRPRPPTLWRPCSTPKRAPAPPPTASSPPAPRLGACNVYVVLFIVTIVAVIMFHEFGHFATAKLFGMKAERFFLGFGPTLWSTKRGETEYGVKAFPAGGFVKIAGMTPWEPADPADDGRWFWQQAAWKRAIVLVSGSFTHFLVAFLLIASALAFVGLPVATNEVAEVVRRQPRRGGGPGGGRRRHRGRRRRGRGLRQRPRGDRAARR